MTVSADAPAPTKRVRKGLQAVHAKQRRFAALLLTPTMVVLAIVIGYPIVRAIWMSFQADQHLDPATHMFVSGGWAGFTNYAHWLLQQCPTATGQMAQCPEGNLGAMFWDAVGVTFLFTVVTVVLETLLGLWFAVIMNRGFHGRGIVRAAVLIPWAIPTAVTSKLWKFLFESDGAINHIFGTQILWTSGEWSSRFAIIIADTWKTTPFMALLILAGLQLIPEEIYEAAKVDGTNAWQRFVSITLPLIKPALLVAILFRVMDALRMYDLPAIFTQGGGGKGDATTTLSILVVDQIRQGFNSAAALSTLTFIIIFIVALLFIRVSGTNLIGNADEEEAL